MICKWCKKDIGDVHKNRRYCSTSCMDKARYAKSGQRSTKIQRSLWYKSRCLKEGYKEKLRKQENLRNKKVKDFLAEYKLNRGCKDCGYKEHHSSLEFDHISGKKERNVCFAKSIGQAKKEIEKCEVVCSNCHRIRTYKRIYPEFDKIIENRRMSKLDRILGEYYVVSDAERDILGCAMTDEILKSAADAFFAPKYITKRLGPKLVRVMKDCFLRHLRDVKNDQYNNLLRVADGLYESLSDSLRIKTGVTAPGNCQTLLCTVQILEAVKAYKKWKKRAASKRTA